MLLYVLAKVFHTVVFPDLSGPRINQQLLTCKILCKYTTIRQNVSSAINPRFFLALSCTILCNFIFFIFNFYFWEKISNKFGTNTEIFISNFWFIQVFRGLCKKWIFLYFLICSIKTSSLFQYGFYCS